jgi:rhodanese-related sulfurtransferase
LKQAPRVPTRRSAADVRADLLARHEIALLDVREEAHHAEGHPLFAASLPLSRLEFEAYARIPRRTTAIVLLDNGEGLATLAAERLFALGYHSVALLEDGLQGWRNAGYELFRDVNSPSKAFGELVEAQRQTPFLSAEEVKMLIDTRADTVIVDARRFDEFQTMSIPTATSVPGAELALRVRALAPRPETRVVVNCAGRTRSIIGAQSLINAGLPNPVAALRNGTIGWKLAGQELDHGQLRKFPEVDDTIRKTSAAAARRVADRAGVKRVDLSTTIHWIEHGSQTVYRFDVRTPEEFVSGHLPGFRNAPGGQLVQETDGFAPVRGARIVLVDDDGTRANMTASWLAQMAWDVFVIDSDVGEPDGLRARFTERGRGDTPLPALPTLTEGAAISPSRLAEWLQPGSDSAVVVFDFAPSSIYAKGHIPGSWFALRSSLAHAFNAPAAVGRYVFTSPDGLAARFAWADACIFTTKPLHVLDGGTAAWTAHGETTDNGAPRYASPPIDRYKRPYEGTDSPAADMQAYLDWEYGLVDQLNRDGTHGFRVL